MLHSRARLVRLFCIAVALALIPFCFFSCSYEDKTDIYSLACEIHSELGTEVGNKAVFYFDEARNRENGQNTDSFTVEKGELYKNEYRAMKKEDFAFLYTGKKEELPFQNRITGYAVVLSGDQSGYEIHIVKCASPSDAEEMKLYMDKRIDALKNAEISEYAPQGYEKYMKTAKAAAHGRIAYLLAVGDIERAERLI